MSIHNSKQIEDVKILLLKGDKGKDGITIESIEKTGSSGLVDTYTITFTDGSKTTFTITNGDSIASIAKTGSSGLVDTYTITMVSGSTSTFTVTNAKSIESIQKTSTVGNVDTYTITMNDGTTTTFDVTNAKSIESIQKTSTVGNVDTYTITMNDGTTTTFDVTNANTVILEENFANRETSTTASRTYQVGEYLVLNSKLYKVTQAIAQGGTISVGVNVTQKNIGDELSLLSKKGVPILSVNGITTPQTLTLNRPITDFKRIKINTGTYYANADLILYKQQFDIDIQNVDYNDQSLVYSWFRNMSVYMWMSFGMIDSSHLKITELEGGATALTNFAFFAEIIGYENI